MKQSISYWQVAGFLFTSLLGTFLHFLFDLSGQHVIAAIFSAVNESIARSRKYFLRGAKVYKRTGQNRPIEVIEGSTPNNAHEAYHQTLAIYLKKLYPETEEECILRMSDELQKSETDGFAESLVIRAEEAKERITALGKGIPD